MSSHVAVGRPEARPALPELGVRGESNRNSRNISNPYKKHNTLRGPGPSRRCIRPASHSQCRPRRRQALYLGATSLSCSATGMSSFPFQALRRPTEVYQSPHPLLHTQARTSRSRDRMAMPALDRFRARRQFASKHVKSWKWPDGSSAASLLDYG